MKTTKIVLTHKNGSKYITRSDYKPKTAYNLQRPVTKKTSVIEIIKRQWRLFKERNKRSQRQAQASAYLFDLTKDCPDYIINCYEIRETYKAEIDKLQSAKICSACRANSIKQMLLPRVIFQEDFLKD